MAVELVREWDVSVSNETHNGHLVNFTALGQAGGTTAVAAAHVWRVGSCVAHPHFFQRLLDAAEDAAQARNLALAHGDVPRGNGRESKQEEGEDGRVRVYRWTGAAWSMPASNPLGPRRAVCRRAP